MSEDKQFSLEELQQYLLDSSSLNGELARTMCVQASRAIAAFSERSRILTAERDESEARAVALMLFVPDDVRISQIKTLRDAYRTWREWFSVAPDRNIRNTDLERLLALTVAPMNRSRSVLSIHFNRGMSADEMNRLHEHLLHSGASITTLQEAKNRALEMEARAVSLLHLLPAETRCGQVAEVRDLYRAWRASVEGKKAVGPYRVVEGDARPCAHCTQGMLWRIVSGEGEGEIAIGSSWGDEDFAHDICDLMNMAYDAGREVGR